MVTYQGRRPQIISMSFFVPDSGQWRSLTYFCGELFLFNAIISLFESSSTDGFIYSSCAPSTGFNPRWDCTLSFQMQVPDLALVRFVVEDHDHTAKNDFVGQFTLPFTSLRTGNNQKAAICFIQQTSLVCALYNVCTVFFFLRLSTCSPIKGRWFESVPCHALYPRQSEERSSRQNCVRAYRHCQRQGMNDVHLNQMESCIFRQQRALETELWMWGGEGLCRCCCQSIPRVVQFKPSHFPTQEERWCLSEMKEHAGSQQMNCLELDNKSLLHCGSIWSCQCWGLWKRLRIGVHETHW